MLSRLHYSAPPILELNNRRKPQPLPCFHVEIAVFVLENMFPQLQEQDNVEPSIAKTADAIRLHACSVHIKLTIKSVSRPQCLDYMYLYINYLWIVSTMTTKLHVWQASIIMLKQPIGRSVINLHTIIVIMYLCWQKHTRYIKWRTTARYRKSYYIGAWKAVA